MENEGPLQKQVIVSHPRNECQEELNSTANGEFNYLLDNRLTTLLNVNGQIRLKGIKGIFSKMSIIHDLHMILQSNEANHNFRGE